MTLIDQLAEAGKRFHGISLDYRRSGTNWPHDWRVRLLATKNERDGYRLELFADDPQKALDLLLEKVAEIDQSTSPG